MRVESRKLAMVWRSLAAGLCLLCLPAVAQEDAAAEPETTLSIPDTAASAPMTDDASKLGIAAIVNDDVISTRDLQDRIDFILKTSGREDSPEIRAKLRGQVLQMLIDETLKVQDAKRFSIQMGRSDIEDAIARIEQQQQKPAGTLEKYLEAQGISLTTFHNQIKSDVAWNKLIMRKIRKDIAISDDEIYRAQQRLARGNKIKEVQIASIILPIDDKKESETLGLARDIRSQLLAGKDGPTLVKEYADRIPLQFGPLTWAPRSDLHPDIAKAIEPLKVGEISEPVRSPIGFQIIRLLDERTTTTVPEENAEVAVKQIVMKLDEESMKEKIEAMMEIAREVAKHPGSCVEKGVAGMQDLEGLNIEVNFIRTTYANMSKDIRYLVQPLKVTQITEPFAAPDGIHLLMLCEKMPVPTKLPDREAVKQALFQEKLELEIEKYLRTLRREAFIDIRI